MSFIKFIRQSQEREPISSILLIIGFVLVGMFLGGLLQALVLLVFELRNSGFESLPQLVEQFEQGEIDLFSNWWALNLSVGIASFFTFIVSGLVYWWWIEKKKWSDFSLPGSKPNVKDYGLVTLIYFTSAPFIAYLADINEHIQMPGFLKGVEDWMRTMEDSALAMTDFLASTTSIGQLLANIIVVGIFAGVGEELVFRGLLQRKLTKIFKNYHWAVWAAAIIFSAIHFQFYGFFPRLLLGVLFGYLYIWSGNIMIPIFAHALNNSMAVLIGHLISTGVISSKYEDFDLLPFPLVVVTAVICAFLLFNYSQKQAYNN